MKDRFSFFVSEPVLVMVCGVLSFSILFLMMSVLLDKLRMTLFELLHVKKAAEKIEQMVESGIRQVSRII